MESGSAITRESGDPELRGDHWDTGRPPVRLPKSWPETCCSSHCNDGRKTEVSVKTIEAIAAPLLRQGVDRHEPGRLGVELVPRQRVWLSRGLVALCQWRLEHILHHCDPHDVPLAKFLKEQIAAEEESADSLKRLDWDLPRSNEVVFCSKECDQLLSVFLPSAFSRFGEGFLDREAALHFVEILESDRHSFFSHVLEGLSEDPSGIRLKVESERSAERLRLVRTMVLPPARSSQAATTLATTKGRCYGAMDRRSWVVEVSSHINRLKDLHRAAHSAAELASGSDSLPGLSRPLVTTLLRDLAEAARVAEGSDEPLATRFIREFAEFRIHGPASMEGILGVARVALAWLLCGHTRRSHLRA